MFGSFGGCVSDMRKMILLMHLQLASNSNTFGQREIIRNDKIVANYKKHSNSLFWLLLSQSWRTCATSALLLDVFCPLMLAFHLPHNGCVVRHFRSDSTFPEVPSRGGETPPGLRLRSVCRPIRIPSTPAARWGDRQAGGGATDRWVWSLLVYQNKKEKAEKFKWKW